MKKQENHPDYNLLLPYWLQVRTFIRGMRDVQDYLQDVTRDASPEGIRRNIDYKARAKYTNFTSRTLEGLVGSVFRTPAIVELSSDLEYLILNANGAGLTLDQLTKDLVTNIISIGRHGLFVDYGTQAKIVTYTAENIINWATDATGILVEVVLKIDAKTNKKLKLEDGIYSIDIIVEDKVTSSVKPTKADGTTFDVIPFIMCGSKNNDPEVDNMPLWAIVDVSQGHYQNSADYEDLLRYCVPTPAITAPNKSWLDEMLPSGVYTFGDGSIIPLPDNGTATLLQANENQMHAKAMESKENQLIMLGARIFTGKSGQAESTETVKIRFSSENSMLDNLVGNAESAINQCLKWCADFMGSKGDIVFTLNKEFFDTTLSPQEITAQILLLDRGVVATSDVRNNLRKAEFIASGRTDEEIDAEIEASGGGL